MSSPIVPVILSGGSGSRLWPLSRTAYPKQFLSLGGDCSLFQQSVARIASLVQAALPVYALSFLLNVSPVKPNSSVSSRLK